MQPGAARDDKVEALREHNALNPTPERVTDEQFQTDGFFDPRDLVQVKYEMVRRVHVEGATVTHAAQTFGVSRPTFYHARQTLRDEGLAGLVPKQPGPRGGHKLTAQVLEFVGKLQAESPVLSSKALAAQVKEHFGLSVHPRSIERALDRQEKKRRRPN